MVAMHSFADIAGFNALISSCACNGDVGGAEMWLSQMVVSGAQPDAESFDAVIHAHIVGGDALWPQRAMYWVTQMRFQGLQPHPDTCAALMRRCSWTGELSLQDMQAFGCKPTSTNIAMRTPSFENADGWIHPSPLPCEMNPMTAMLPDVPVAPVEPTASPDATNYAPPESSVTYGSLIKACAHRGEVARAEGLLRRMVEDGYEPTLVALNAVIHACTQTGDLAKAEHYLEAMEAGAAGSGPDVITYNSVINACAAQGEAARAEALLLRMISRGLAPNEVTYGTICKAFARQGEVAAVERIMSALEKSGTPLNEYFYASLISACGAAQPPDPARAEKALAELESRGLRAQSVKRVLAAVLGERRAAELMQAAGERRAAELASSGGSLLNCKTNCLKDEGRGHRNTGRHRGGRRGRAAGA